MILIDSNVPMYLIGADHPNKLVATRLLEQAIIDGVPLVTDAEALQEILHRYGAIRRLDAIRPAFDAVLGVVDDVIAIDRAVVDRARQLVESESDLSARDAIHVAVMRHHGITTIMSFDRAFDRVQGIVRLPR